MKAALAVFIASPIVAALVTLAGARTARIPAPEFHPSGRWFNIGANAAPPSLHSLRGRVVLVEFWTAECSNCTRSAPTLRSLYAKYRAKGLEIIGVHTPETRWQRPPGVVAAWIKREAIAWPVFQDNESVTWNAYGNSYWPAFYLVDRRGNIADRVFGELSQQYPDGIAPFTKSIETVLAEKP